MTRKYGPLALMSLVAAEMFQFIEASRASSYSGMTSSIFHLACLYFVWRIVLDIASGQQTTEQE